MDRGDTHSVKAGIELLPGHFTRVVIIWFILITLDDIFFNTLTTKGMSRNNIVTLCLEFFRHQEGNLFFICTLCWCDPSTPQQYLALLSTTFPNNYWWWKQSISSPSWPNNPALHSNISWISSSRSVNFTVPVVQQNSVALCVKLNTKVTLWLRHILITSFWHWFTLNIKTRAQIVLATEKNLVSN